MNDHVIFVLHLWNRVDVSGNDFRSILTYLLEHNFSINYEIKSVKILNRNRTDAAPCFILAINNSPMDTKNNCEFEWFSKVFFSENKQQKNNW